MVFDYAAESREIIEDLLNQQLLGKLRHPTSPAYSDYVLKVKEQQQKYPNYPKIEPNLSEGPQLPVVSSDSAINKIINENYTYTGTKRIRKFNVYEFAQPVGNASDISYYRFLYVFIDKNSTEILGENEKLPKLLRWGEEYPSAYPDNLYLVSAGINSWPDFYTTNSVDTYHPFLPGFYSTNRVSIQTNGKIIYEYFDSLGLYGALSNMYVSTLRPVNFDFPIGHPRMWELAIDNCLSHLIGSYPIRSNEFYLGRFTGFTSTPLHTGYAKFYLYERKDGTTFLSEEAPDLLAQEIIERTLILGKVGSPQPTLLEGSGSIKLQNIQNTIPEELIIQGF